jgi:PBP1b-binding outer membrane lipoprotein LpoB
MDLVEKGGHMKKLIALIIAGIIFILGCAQNKNLTEEEKEKYQRARQRYQWGQRH